MVSERTSEEPMGAPRPAASVESASDGQEIELRLPGTATHVPVVRALAADLAARLDFDLDQISDLRMAVDEVCADLVATILPAERLTCVFRAEKDTLWVTASAVTRTGAVPPRTTFGWRVLTALVDEVDSWADADQTVFVRLGKHRLSGFSA
jgi:serine/threonine-protein kinase RsbW